MFGANPEEHYANKPLTLNGESIGILPPNNRYACDQLQERVMEIPAAALKAIAGDNTLTIANCGGDCFKFCQAILAVQLADGTWVESNCDGTVYCTGGAGWPHFEGTLFQDKSPEVKLSLPVQHPQ